MLLPISPSFLSSQSVGVIEKASNLVLFIAVFNLGNRKSQSVLNHGIRVDWITHASFCQKLGDSPKNVLVHCRAEDTRTHFPETQA
jgi:hypothetical protein